MERELCSAAWEMNGASSQAQRLSPWTGVHACSSHMGRKKIRSGAATAPQEDAGVTTQLLVLT